MFDGWLRSVLDGDHGDLPESLVIAVGGRQRLDAGSWMAYLPVTADVALTPFTEGEARQFLAERGILDEDVAHAILQVSGRLPLQLAMLAETRPSEPGLIGDLSGDAVD